MKIVAATCVRNRENFIGAYLDMLLDFGITPIVAFGTRPWSNHADDEDEKPDRTEYILDTYFPNVNTIKDYFAHHRDSINRCVQNAGEYDLMLVNDCDMFITRDDWASFLKFEDANKDREVYSINFEKMIIEYYYDWRFGKAAIPGGDWPIVAMKPMVEFRHMTKTSCDNEVVWDEVGPKYHHMRFCKKNRIDRRCNIPTDTGNHFPAPPEIFDRLERWQGILENLK